MQSVSGAVTGYLSVWGDATNGDGAELPRSPARVHDAFLSDAIQAISLRPTWSPEAHARDLFMSPSRFAHRFRELAGLSPGAYARALRIQEAKRLLLTTAAPVLEVAEEVGYDSLGTFTTRFATHVGVPPGRFRQLTDIRLPPVSQALRQSSRTEGGRRGAYAFRAFVGLFRSRLPAGRPAVGGLFRVPGRFVLTACMPGNYYVLSAMVPDDVPSADLLLSAPSAVAMSPGPVEVAMGRTTTCDLRYRSPSPGDPPVIVSLAVLAAPRPGGRGQGRPFAPAFPPAPGKK